jgi:hypothetical protein
MSPARQSYRFPFIAYSSDPLRPIRTIDFQPLSFHQLTNPFFSNSFVLSSIQIARVSNPTSLSKETTNDSAIR